MAVKVNFMMSLLYLAAILDFSSSFRFSAPSSYPRPPLQYPAYNQPAYAHPAVPAYYQTTTTPSYPTQPITAPSYPTQPTTAPSYPIQSTTAPSYPIQPTTAPYYPTQPTLNPLEESDIDELPDLIVALTARVDDLNLQLVGVIEKQMKLFAETHE